MEDILCNKAIYWIFPRVMNIDQPIFQNLVAHCAYLLIKKLKVNINFRFFLFYPVFFLVYIFFETNFHYLSESSLELTIWPKLFLISQFFCPNFLSVGIYA